MRSAVKSALRALGAAGIAGVLATSAMAAGDGWTPYHNASFQFSADFPGTPQVLENSVNTAAGPAPSVMVVMAIENRGAVLVGATDYKGLAITTDIDQSLEGAVQGSLTAMKATLDSETKTTVQGAPARDIRFHTGEAVGRALWIRAGDRAYGVMGIGAAATGVPPEYDRVRASFVFGG
jgi:hypothetical protein